MAAPGDHIYSTKQNGYEYSEGTSFSSPLVAGIAALLISKNPNLTPEEIRTILEETALDKGASGRDDKYGWGIVQADAALLHVPLMHSTISSALSAASSGQKITVSPGAYTESTDLTVPTGVTLDMTAGGTLQMADDKQIIVNGTLNAKNATFTASANDWGGIRFNSGSGGEIYNCSLSKCGYPYYIYIYNASPTIQANTLSQWAGAYNGIYVRGSNADPTLYDNDIEINYTGVRFDNYAAGELSYNLIHVTNMYDPVLYAVGGAWVDADYRGANTFREGRYGIAAQSSARVDVSGTFSENDFCETGMYDLYATSSSSIYANYCNFPGASPTTYADGTSTITTQYASNSDGYCSQLSKTVPLTFGFILPTLTLSFQGRRTIVSNRNHRWYITAGTRIYHRLEIGYAVDNRQDLLRCKLALNTDFFYRRNMISIVGGLGYTHHLTSHWLLQLALAGEYGLQSLLSDNRGIILEYFTNPHFVSLVPRIEVQYKF